MAGTMAGHDGGEVAPRIAMPRVQQVAGSQPAEPGYRRCQFSNVRQFVVAASTNPCYTAATAVRNAMSPLWTFVAKQLKSFVLKTRIPQSIALSYRCPVMSSRRFRQCHRFHQRKYFARVQQPFRVECRLDRALLIQLMRGELHRHQVAFFDADAMLPGQAAADLDA